MKYKMMVDRVEFSRALKQISNAFKRKGRVNLEYVHFEINKGGRINSMRIEATNSHVLERVRLNYEPIDGKEFIGEFLITKEAFKAVMNEVLSLKGNRVKIVLRKVTTDFRELTVGNVAVPILNAADYPWLGAVIPSLFDARLRVEFKVSQLLPLLRMIKKEHKQRWASLYIRLIFDGGQHRFGISSVVGNKIGARIDITSLDGFDGGYASFDVNVQSLINCLNKRKLSETVTMLAYGATRPITVISDDRLSLVCPVRRF